MRNTLELLEQIRNSAETLVELKSDVCKEIYYSTKDVRLQLDKNIKKFQKALNQPGLTEERGYMI